MTAPPGLNTTAPEIKVNGRPISHATLGDFAGMRVTTGLRIPSRAELHFYDRGYEIAGASMFAIGTAVAVAMGGGDNLFDGEVTGVELQLDRGIPFYTVIADDPSYKLTLGAKTKTYLQVSYSDIVTTIAAAAGLRARVESTTPMFDYVLQTDTDFGFLCELADRSGCDWWVSPDKILHFAAAGAPTGAPVSLTFGETLDSFSVRASALHPGDVTVTGWAPAHKQAVVAQAAAAAAPAKPTATLISPFVAAGSLSGINKTKIASDTPLSAAEAGSLAKRAVAGWSAGACTARGSCRVNPRIVPLVQVSIAGVGPASGTYLVTEVEHSYTPRGFETRFTAGERRPRALVDTLAAQQRGSFRRDGLVVGVVTQVGNSEGSPGDVKVSYPASDEQLASNWARVLTPGGGSKRGLTFMPEINDEVIVGFEGGDPRRPVVLGGVFNGKDAQPPFRFTNNEVSTRQITSRLGHTVEFGDGTAEDDQYIGLALAGGHHILKLGKKALDATVPAGVPINLKAGTASIVISDAGEITITGKKITLKADTDIEMSGLNVTAKGNAKFAASAAIVQLKANGQAEVTSSGPAMIKGNPVMIN